MCILPLLAISFLPLPSACCCRGDEQPVKIVVLTILASETDTEITPKIKEIATEIQKQNPKLTGFKLHRTVCTLGLKPGDKISPELVEDAKVEIKLKPERDEEGRVTITIKPPKLEEITYACKCGKYFPIVTSYKTEKGEQLIIAVMATPCNSKK